ncbi:MAG: TIGR02147 family protein [Pseudobdellovibrionaceae bacterium]
MNIYDYDDYKKYWSDRSLNRPKKGHGENSRLAKYLNVSTTMVSQVFKGDKHISLEMACDIADYLNLSIEEKDYFILITDYQKANSNKLKIVFKNQIKRIQKQQKKLETKITNHTVLNETEKSIFYSSWIYSAIGVLVDLGKYNNAQDIAQRLSLNIEVVEKALQFLLSSRLIIQDGKKIKMGSVGTHTGDSSLLTKVHHSNWRIKSIECMDKKDPQSLFFSAPLVLSESAAIKIRQEIFDKIQDIIKQVVPSDSETVRCLNIDWFEF